MCSRRLLAPRRGCLTKCHLLREPAHNDVYTLSRLSCVAQEYYMGITTAIGTVDVNREISEKPKNPFRAGGLMPSARAVP
jgi:hypothetical protein